MSFVSLLKKVLLIGVVAVIIIPTTLSFFSDKEISNDNSFNAGRLDLKVNDSDNPGILVEINDLKPGDDYRILKQLRVIDNPARLYLQLTSMESSQGEQFEPEEKEEESNGIKHDIQSALEYDLTFNSEVIFDLSEHKTLEKLSNCWIPIGEIDPNVTYDMEQSFHMPTSVTNWAQGDTLQFDEIFYAVQSRHTDDYEPSVGGAIWDSEKKECTPLIPEECSGSMICGNTCIFNGLTYGTVKGADGKCWLDRNLGATQVATESNDIFAYGWIYQWGRGTDGHQIPTSNTTNIISDSDTPGHGNFIIEPSYSPMPGPFDWRDPQNDNLWQGVDGINNPCPNGFRIPSREDWIALVNAAGITNSATAFNSSLKLTMAGYRGPTSATYEGQGNVGYYWSSTPINTEASQLKFNSSSVSPSNTYLRNTGFSVRCIANSILPLPTTVPTPVPPPSSTPTPTSTPMLTVWINELHYDNEGTNTEEGVEISGQAGTDLSGWRLVFYDGATGAIYDTLSLTGIIPDQQNGFGTIWFPKAGIQNGFFDGIVLENPSAEAIQFISYEGVMYAIHGSVSGQNSVDIGVSEHPPAPVGYSLQLSGTGHRYADFSWTGPIEHTRGSINTGQTFD